MLRKVLTAFPVVLVSLFGTNGLAQGVSPLDQLSEEQLELTVNFVLGNASFELYRQASAALIDDASLTQLEDGRNTIDELTTILMFEGNDIWLETAIVNATDSWFLGRQSDLASSFPSPQYTQLVPPQRRDRDIACLMIGRDKDGYADLAKTMDLDAAQWPSCVQKFPAVVQYWDEKLQDFQSTDNLSDFILTYVGTSAPELSDFATMIEESKVFDMITRRFEEFKLKGPIHLVAKSCGRPDVYWSKEDRQITYCYEHALYQGALIAGHLNKISDNGSLMTGDDPVPVNAEKAF